MSHSGGEVAQLPDGDVGVHLLEVVPDHHGAVLLLVQTVHHNSAVGEKNTKWFFCRLWTTRHKLTCGRPAWRIVAAGEAGGDEEEGGEEDEVGQQGGGEDVVVVPVGVLPQVGQRGLVDEGGEGEPIFVLLEVGSRRWSEVVDEEGDGREEVDLQADDDQHPLEVEVVEGGLAALLQHPLVLAAKKKVNKRRSSHLAEGKGVMMRNAHNFIFTSFSSQPHLRRQK